MHKVVGLVPAAGHGKRVALLPCSKEIFPIGLANVVEDERGGIRPKAVGEYLLERMQVAGVTRVFIILSRGKWDIMHYFGDGDRFGLHIAYLLQENVWGMPYALDLARPWLCDETVLFGMPDTIFQPEDAFQRLLLCHQGSSADITLGLFPTTAPERFGMVEFDNTSRRALYIIDKPSQTHLRYMWGIGCWGPTFTEFLHSQLQVLSPPQKEIVLGDIFQAAIENGLEVQVLPFEGGEFIDIGVSEEMVRTIKRFACNDLG
ncbi:MAG: sugar phosphate nucleotidyltransferase [Anaerolineae bacterium]